MQGIYQWTVSRPDGSALVYVGQSTAIERRKRAYISDWGGSRHHDTNSHLKQAVLKYGPQSVMFEVLELVEGAEEELAEAENRWWRLRVAELGLDNVANKVEPGLHPSRDPAVAARQAQSRRENPDWRRKVVESGRRAFASRSEESEQRRRQAHLEATAKPFALISPVGLLVTGTNLNALCQEHDLDNSTMTKVNRGLRRSYKGWTRAE